MVENRAACVHAARAWAWISALFSHASFVACTIGIDRTFWSTIWRYANIVVDASTYRTIIN